MQKNSVQHTPFRPARQDLAEAYFLRQWQDLNAAIPNLLPDIIGRTRCDVRSARVAASFITWIGTNAGAAFIQQAKDLIENYTYWEPAYLAAWALTNRRLRHVNSGVRAIESILSSENLFSQDPFSHRERASRVSISMEDIDVVEAVVVWLSTRSGDAFIESCNAEYQAIRLLERSKHNLTPQP